LPGGLSGGGSVGCPGVAGGISGGSIGIGSPESCSLESNNGERGVKFHRAGVMRLAQAGAWQTASML
jgi:hypothetical protein